MSIGRSCLAAAIAAMSVLAAGQLRAQTTKGNVSVPKASDGHPDLQGIWTNVTLTTLERPPEFGGKATLSDAEARVYEKNNVETGNIDEGVNNRVLQQAGSAGTGAYNDLFIDRGSELARVDGLKRTSLIVDPPDGRIPPRVRTATAGRPLAGIGGYNDVKDRPLSERCIIGFGSTAGPPMLPVLYNNNYQIVQTPDAVMILVEMIHDTRIVRINGTHPAADIRFLLGDSIGHWEGDTLVVDTSNFDPRTAFRGASPNLHVIERFRRVDGRTILYRATIDDPAFSKPWTLEYPFVATRGPIYEYACHEGNYAMTDILGGARRTEATEQKK